MVYKTYSVQSFLNNTPDLKVASEVLELYVVKFN